MRELCVVGLGLIGGSVLRAAVAAGWTAWGATASEEDAGTARADGFDVVDLVEALARAQRSDALVVLAVPLPAVERVLRMLPAGVRLTDVVSVKGPVADLVGRCAPSARYVGGHPMAGTSASGWAASDVALFRGAAWVVAAEDGCDLDVLGDVVRLALAVGAHVVPTDADEHDVAVARVSHLPHVLAAVLASVGAEGGPLALALAAGSFGDATRVAGSDPDLVRAMCEGNRNALLGAVDDALGRLGAARGSLASTGGLAKTIDAGHAARGRLDALRADEGAEVTVDLAARDAREALRAVGARGGRVVALDGTTALARTF
ncbi:prephenate dehydrogenase [Actinosynnema pretiosum subsp. pretiosum]|uniref:Prephenate dehydrogenase n=2 Tax=Actinosynnema TaxID=40566 RepID=C6WDZ4_ACTMD|nr:prephenate dehydrogenase [Actinosynnema mirum]ACU34139.1 Prephenate dehydrogenase [Actinosynnema mirum DSM 43827]AXX27535.1 Arogenate dehydrogenase [Actinosynnema pretiosum subsp. pretiosum]QUF01753.1 prephenate dehydrogenase [Actinosynnema pretiosum subsp. pretiosum]